MLPGRTVPPCTGQGAGLAINLDDLSGPRVVELSSAATDLAASLSTRGVSAAWLRLEPTDRDVQLQRRLVQRALAEHPAPRRPDLLVIDDAYRTLDRSTRAAARDEPATVVLARTPVVDTAALGPELASLTNTERDALLLTARLGYAHPDLVSVAVAARDASRWLGALEPLSDGWVRVRPSRRSGLERQLRSGGPVERARLHELIAALMTHGAAIEAVELCLASNAARMRS